MIMLTNNKFIKVQKTNTGKLKEHYISVLNKIDIIREDDSAIGPGSVDIWKNYLAVGSTQLRVVNLDGGSILLKTICSEVSIQLIKFTCKTLMHACMYIQL